MSRAEDMRRRIVESESTLARYSLSQRSLKQTAGGEKKLEAQRNSKLANQGAVEYQPNKDEQLAKVERVTQRVRNAFNGYDGFDGPTLLTEVRFLKRNGVSLESIINCDPTHTK